MSDHAKEARNKNDVLVKGGTRREVKKAAKAEYGKVKIKTAKRLSESERGRLAQETVTKRTKEGVRKTVKRGTRVPKWAVVLPKEKPPRKPPGERKIKGTPSL